MSVTTATSSLALRRLGAIVLQAVSYLTTLNAVAYFTKPTTETMWATTAGIALAAEIGLIALKEALFGGGDPVGWLGVVADGIVNAGGILPIAPRILTFAPIAVILGLIGVNVADPTTSLIGSLIIAIILGGALSYVPHRLWRAPRGRSRE